MGKKALHNVIEPLFVYKNGTFEHSLYDIDMILNWVNESFDVDSELDPKHQYRFRLLHGWLNRFMCERENEQFYNDLNSVLQEINFIGYVLPPNFYDYSDDECKAAYVADFDGRYSNKALAAFDFSRLVATGRLERIRKCQLQDCGKFFTGPKRAKWCSKTCGSKSRVRKMRKRSK